jgi:hypothetical protein
MIVAIFLKDKYMAFRRIFGGPNQPSLDEQQKRFYDEHLAEYNRCEKVSDPVAYRDCHVDLKLSYNRVLKRLIRDDSQNPMNQPVCDFTAAMADLRAKNPTDSKRDLVRRAVHTASVQEQKRNCESAIITYRNMLRQYPQSSRYLMRLEAYGSSRFQLPATPSRPSDIVSGNKRVSRNVNSLLSHAEWCNSVSQIEDAAPAPTATPSIKQPS